MLLSQGWPLTSEKLWLLVGVVIGCFMPWHFAEHSTGSKPFDKAMIKTGSLKYTLGKASLRITCKLAIVTRAH